MSVRIQVVDFAKRDEARFVDEVCSGLSEQGFVQVVNHPVSLALRMQAEDVLGRVMALPEEVLRELSRPEIFYQRGYSPYGSEAAAGVTDWDLKRYWMIRNPDMPELASDCPFGPNVWVPQIPQFQHVMINLFDAKFAVVYEVLRAIEKGFGLPEGSMVDATEGSETILRPIQYDPLAFYGDVPPTAVRSHEHFDINALTCLTGSAKPKSKGRRESTLSDLELLIRGTWERLELEANALIIDNGEQIGMFPGMPDGALPPMRHRVRNPDDPLSTRRVFPLFQHWRRSVVLKDGVTAGEKLDRRIAELTGNEYQPMSA